MASNKKISKQEAIAACEGCMGIAEIAAGRLGVSRVTFWKYRTKWPEVQEALDNSLQKGLDFAESRLMQLMKDENGKIAIDAVKFYLERKGRGRGWGQQQAVELSQAVNAAPVICFRPMDGNGDGEGEGK